MDARTQFTQIVAKARLSKTITEGVVVINAEDALVPSEAFDTFALEWEHRPKGRIDVDRYYGAAMLRGAQQVLVRAWPKGRVRVIGGVVAS